MADPRLRRMAQVLLQYSLGLKSGERVGIRAEPVASPLIRELVREALHIGAYPELYIEIPGVKELLLKEGSDAQLHYIPDGFRLRSEVYETALDILSQENTKELMGIDPARIALHNQAQKNVFQTIRSRSSEGVLRRSILLYPTNAYAQDADMSLSDFEDFLYHACFLDEEQPILHWQKLSQQQDRLTSWLQGKRTVQIVGKDIDLTFSVEGRSFMSDDGRYNFPGGEIFTSPVENSVNGSIRFSFPASYAGRSVDDVRLRLVDGVVVEAQAGQGQEYLEKMLALDEGARRFGEFAFGNNPNIQRCIKNVLFDEKMAGTIHFALGASFSVTGGKNQSILHWDMVYDLRHGCDIYFDGELFCKDGRFTTNMIEG
ncbi:aminopeptidase [Tengunoibacter tsumagoiensis]|uniref:Aminopeptidase n=1 Tax=Tengunoibacter tsumagoiensis TaxID=2014871 RepID=A0A402A9L9_9CHLR|nr:aminopeptidase [Tengunoibacter tsumagoiensis]